jgi:hypothetical protein
MLAKKIIENVYILYIILPVICELFTYSGKKNAQISIFLLTFCGYENIRLSFLCMVNQELNGLR